MQTSTIPGFSVTGSLVLRTEKPVYHPGETVKGEIQVQIFKQFTGNKLTLKIKGEEETKWTIETTHVRSSGRHTHIKVTKHDYSAYEPVLNFKVPVHTWPQSSVPCGQYLIPFSFLLPANLPGSFYDTISEGFGKITYKLKAEMVAVEATIECDYTLYVRESIADMKRIVKNVNCPVKTWWCLDQGTTQLKSFVDKNAYHPGEIAKVTDNK